MNEPNAMGQQDAGKAQAESPPAKPSMDPGHLAALCALLQSNYSIAHEASLVGTLNEGKKPLIDAYNRVIGHLSQQGALDEAFFGGASPDTSMDEIGVMSKQLEAFIKAKFSAAKGKERGMFDRLKNEKKDLAQLLDKMEHEKEA